MIQYHFSVGETPCRLDFWVGANSRAAAVVKANVALAEMHEPSEAYVASGLTEAHVTVSEETVVTTEHIIEERALLAPPEEALHYLHQNDYENDGKDLDEWRRLCNEQTEPTWTKAFMIGNVIGGEIYGMMNVTVTRTPGPIDHESALGDEDEDVDYSNDKWGFHFRARLYFGVVMGLSEEEGGTRYSIDLRDIQHFIGEEDFAAALEAYEKKFCSLIYALRSADPVDGLPLTQAEVLMEQIEGFMRLRD